MWIIDRLEEGFAVLEHDGICEKVPQSLLPAGCREGSILNKIAGVFVLDTALEQERRNKISRMQDDLFG